MNGRAARTGLMLALCALLPGGCGDDGAQPPGPASTSEAEALADARAMLDERKPQDNGETAP